jgi:hypothetical protein
METTFMERQTPGGFKCTSAPGQGLVFSLLHPPSGVPRRGITTPPPLLPNIFSIRRGYSSYVRHPYWLKPHYEKGRVP